MNILEITKKIDSENLIKLKKHFDELFSYDYNGVHVKHTDILKFLINSYSHLKYQNEWLDSIIIPKLDVRFQTFARIESHTLSYYLSIISTKNDIENIFNECLTLGYSVHMAVDSTTNMREVNMRISFWDRYFYGIEYFVQQMNKRFSFITDKSTHAKQFYFQEMLNFFGLGAETYNINDIFIELNNHFPEGNSDFIQSAERNKKQTLIPYVKFYEYAATMRNSLHNNGFSNKTLNNLDLGVVSYQNIKAGEMINCLSAFHVLILSFPLTQIIQKVVEKTLILAPNELIFDPYTKGLDDFINRNT